MTVVNPLSALGLVDMAEVEKVETVVLSAAASNTSKMLARIIRQKKPNASIFGLSRSDKYDNELKQLGYS